MNNKDFIFSDMFWSDPEWNLDIIPKYSDEFEFDFLNHNEIKDFLKIKIKNNPDLLQKLRYKKIKRILK